MSHTLNELKKLLNSYILLFLLNIKSPLGLSFNYKDL